MDPSGDADWAWRSPAYAWFVVVILALGVTLSFVLAAMLPMTIGPLLRDPAAVVACVALGGVFMISPATLAPVTLQEVVPNEFRGQVFAVYLLVMSLIGYAVGPFAVAFVSDSLLHDEAKVHLSLAIVSGVFLPLSAVILGLGLRARQAIDRGAVAALA